VHLAGALARLGHATVLVDADLARPGAVPFPPASEGYGVADILAGRRSIHEVLSRGSAGLQVVPGAWGGVGAGACSTAALARLVSQLHSLGPHADLVVLDIGANLDRATRTLWSVADDVLLVAAPDTAAILGAYTLAKRCGVSGPAAVATVVNRADPALAAATTARLSRACRRFLALKLCDLGGVPGDGQATGTTSKGRKELPHVAAACGRLAAVFASESDFHVRPRLSRLPLGRARAG
jgi:flagellar biosynthesis protein FlhG